MGKGAQNYMDRLALSGLIVISATILVGAIARYYVLRDAVRRDVDGIDGDIRRMREFLKGIKNE